MRPCQSKNRRRRVKTLNRPTKRALAWESRGARAGLSGPSRPAHYRRRHGRVKNVCRSACVSVPTIASPNQRRENMLPQNEGGARNHPQLGFFSPRPHTDADAWECPHEKVLPPRPPACFLQVVLCTANAGKPASEYVCEREGVYVCLLFLGLMCDCNKQCVSNLTVSSTEMTPILVTSTLTSGL